MLFCSSCGFITTSVSRQVSLQYIDMCSKERRHILIIYRVAQKSLYNVWPAVARNICIGALLFFDGQRCNNTRKICCQHFPKPAYFYLKLRKPMFVFTFTTNICISAVAFSVHRIPCILLVLSFSTWVHKHENSKHGLWFVGYSRSLGTTDY